MLKVGKSEEKGIALSANLKKLKKNMGEDTFAKLLKKIEDISVKRAISSVSKETVAKSETLSIEKESLKNSSELIKKGELKGDVKITLKAEIVKNEGKNDFVEGKVNQKLDAGLQMNGPAKKTESAAGDKLVFNQRNVQKPQDNEPETKIFQNVKIESETKKNSKIQDENETGRLKIEKKGEQKQDKQTDVEALSKIGAVVPSFLNSMETLNNVETKQNEKIKKKEEKSNVRETSLIKIENKKEQITETVEAKGKKNGEEQVRKISSVNLKRVEKLSDEVVNRVKSAEKSSATTDLQPINPKKEFLKIEKPEELKANVVSAKREEKLPDGFITKSKLAEVKSAEKRSVETDIQPTNLKKEFLKIEKPEELKANVVSAKREEKLSDGIGTKSKPVEIKLSEKRSVETDIQLINPKKESFKSEKSEGLKANVVSVKREDKVTDGLVTKSKPVEVKTSEKRTVETDIQLLNPKKESLKNEKPEELKANVVSAKREEKLSDGLGSKSKAVEVKASEKSSSTEYVQPMNLKKESLKIEKPQEFKVDVVSVKREDKVTDGLVTKSKPVEVKASERSSSTADVQPRNPKKESLKNEKIEMAKVNALEIKNEAVELKSNVDNIKNAKSNTDDKKEYIKSTEKKANIEKEQFTVEKIVMGKANTSYEMNSVYAVPVSERVAVDSIKNKNQIYEHEKAINSKENKINENDRKSIRSEKVSPEILNMAGKKDDVSQQEVIHDTEKEVPGIEVRYSQEQIKAFSDERLQIKDIRNVRENMTFDGISDGNIDNNVGEKINNRKENDKTPENTNATTNIVKEKADTNVAFDFKLDTKLERRDAKEVDKKEFVISEITGEYRNQDVSVQKTQTTTSRTDRFAEYSFVIDQLNNGIKQSFNPEMKEFKIRLRPEELGDVEVKISIENQIMKAEFKVESEKIKEIIESRFNELKETLKEKGIYSEAINVTVSDNGRYGQKEQEREWFAERNKKTEKKVIENEKISENSNMGLNRYGYITSSGVNIKA